MADRYKIVRGYLQGGRRTIRTGLTLDEAQEHCRDPETSSKTCTKAAGLRRTKAKGEWFARFMPLKRYTSAWRDTPRTICEVTFADGVRIRAYALRESGKPLDIGRPARAAVEKYRFRKPAGERTVTETGVFGGVSSRDHKKAKAQTRTYTVPVIGAVPEIVELRDTETGDIFDIALANTKTAEMRRGA